MAPVTTNVNAAYSLVCVRHLLALAGLSLIERSSWSSASQM